MKDDVRNQLTLIQDGKVSWNSIIDKELVLLVPGYCFELHLDRVFVSISLHLPARANVFGLT